MKSFYRFSTALLFVFTISLINSSRITAQQITHEQGWTLKWGPTGGTTPAGLDTAETPNIPNRFGSVCIGDLDGDGDKDFISGSNRGTVHLFENTGTATTPHWELSNKFPTLDSIKIAKIQSTNEVRPDLVDIDADGDLDLFIMSRWAPNGFHKLDDVQFYRNIGTTTAPVFTYDTIPGLAFQQVAEFAGVAFGDLDADGDQDFVAGGSDSCTYFENVGTATSPSYVRGLGNNSLFPPSMWTETSFLAPTPDLEDFDGDGDLDLYFQNEAGFIRYIPNHGTPTVPDFSPYLSYPTPTLDTVDFGAFGSMDFEDVTGDGVKDIIASHWNPTLWYWAEGVPFGPSISFSSNNISCNGLSDGYAVASVSGAVGSATYLWSTGAITDSIGGLAAGTYTLTVTDSVANVKIDSIVITEPAVLVAATVVDANTSCNGASNGGATASATGGTQPYTYTWSNAATTAGITGVTAGTYSVTITDQNGCTDSTSTTITEPVVLVASATLDNNATNVAGNNGSVTASATGGTTAYTFAWSNGATTATTNSLSAGTYSVTITDQNGCTDSASVAVVAGPGVSVTIDSNITCNNLSDGGATAVAAGGTTPYTYAWSNSATTLSITGVTAGTYTVTVTDNNGLTATNSGTITQPAVLVAASIVDSNVTCNTFSDGGVTASATGGTAPYTYAWNNSATTASITGVVAGTYTVSITDNNGCGPATSMVTITEPAVLNVTAILDSNDVGNGGGTTASTTGGTMAYTYAWSNGATTASIGGLAVGTYTVTTTDNNGCTDTDNLMISANPVPTVNIDSNISCNGFSDGGATVTAVGGTPPYTYAWNNTATTASITGIVAGTYTVTVTDNNGLTGTAMGTVTQPAALVAAIVVDSNVTCKSGSNGGVTASATGGTAPYSYTWNNTATTASITGITAGTYTATITDANGCTSTSNATITEPDSIQFNTLQVFNVTCNGGSDAGFAYVINGGTPTISGGDTNYLISLGGPALKRDAGRFFGAGELKFVVSDANQCLSDTVRFNFTEPTAVVASITNDSNTTCNGTSDGGATASATGGTGAYTYAWSNSATTASITGVAAGNYTVTITDASGCTDTETATITEPAVLVAASVADSNATCNGFADGGATASATGGTAPYTYAWSNSATTASITGVAAGTYTTTITDANGCTSSSGVSISEPALLAAATVIDSNLTCKNANNGGATASATGGIMPYTYAWSNSATTASITGVVAGTYTATITDANGCTSTSNATITEPDSIQFNTLQVFNVTCNGGSDAGFAYVINGGTPTISGGDTNYLISLGGQALKRDAGRFFGAGELKFVVSDANQCLSDTVRFNFTEPTAVVASITNDSNTTCNGTSDGGATASATGGTGAYTYAWSNSATTASITGVAAGNYTVTVTDANGCTDNSTITITEPAILVAATAIDSNVTCNTFSNGGATASATGGTMPYAYLWSNTATTASITGVVAGTYSVTITDANGCTSTSSTTVTEPTTLVAATVVDSNVTCNTFADGGATASATGGTMPYTYLWNNTATTASITGVTAGTYSVTITDANGCTSTSSTNITEPNVLVATAVVDSNATCLGFTDGGASANATGGTMPYNYLWSNSATTASITGVADANYTVTITDANGCSSTSSVTIIVVDTVKPNVVAQNVTVYLDATGVASIATADVNNGSSDACGIQGLTLDITNFSCSDVGANTVQLRATDVNGNIDSAAATVTVVDTIKPTVVTQNVTIYLDAAGAASISTTDVDNGTTDICGAPTLSLDITSFTCTEVGANTVQLRATDVNGNIDSASAVITVVDTIRPNVVTQNVTIYLDAIGAASITTADINNGSTDNCAIQGMSLDITSFSCINVGANTVQLRTTDVNNNIDSASAVVTVLDTINPLISGCPTNINQTIDAGNCTAVVTWTVPTAADNCTVDSLVASHNPGDVFALGTTTVTYIAYDPELNTDTCTFTVTITDSEDPVITNLPSNITINNDLGNCGAVATWTSATASDNCQLDSLRSDFQSGENFPVGTTTVTYTAYDASMNTTTASFTVTVEDNELPIITCPANMAQCDSVVNFTAATATDNCGVSSIVRLDNTGLNSGDEFPIGITTISYLVTDVNNNEDSCSFEIEVYAPPVANAGEDLVTRDIQPIVIEASSTNGASFRWTPAFSVAIDTAEQPIVNPQETTTYTMEVTTAEGCIVTDEVTVTVNVVTKLDATTLFSPNGDGMNDTWVVNKPALIDGCKLIIVNRNGSEVYSTSQYNNEWDGTVNGTQLPEGTYYYIFDCPDGRTLNGPITILRERR